MNSRYIFGTALLACLLLATMPVQALQPGQDFNGPHYNLNLIGVPQDKTADITSGNRIFLYYEGHTNILLRKGDYQVIDGNGTDGTASFQLPRSPPVGVKRKPNQSSASE